MNRDQLEGKWKEIKGKARQQWSKLTDDDVENVRGKFETLSGRLQQRYGYEKEEADREVSRWLDSV